MRFKLKSMRSPGSFKACLPPDIKISIFYHITTTPDAQTNCPVPTNISLYEKIRKESLDFKKMYQPIFLSILLFSDQLKSHLGSEKLIIFRETLMK